MASTIDGNGIFHRLKILFLRIDDGVIAKKIALTAVLGQSHFQCGFYCTYCIEVSQNLSFIGADPAIRNGNHCRITRIFDEFRRPRLMLRLIESDGSAVQKQAFRNLVRKDALIIEIGSERIDQNLPAHRLGRKIAVFLLFSFLLQNVVQ